MNDKENFIDINSIMNNNSNNSSNNSLSMSEILNDTEKKDNSKVSGDDIISIDRMFDTNNEEKIKEMKRDKRIERIQIGLILFLIIVGNLVYFFGYDFFEPYIKID